VNSFGQFFDLTMWVVIGSLAMTLVITLLIVGVIIWIVWRVSRGVENPAVTELKRRLASGEISPVEYEVRMRALEDGS
jgi:uncharacterized membrane protein